MTPEKVFGIIWIYSTYQDVEEELRAVNFLRANRAEAVIFTGCILRDNNFRKQLGEYIEVLQSNGGIVIGITEHPFSIRNLQIGNCFAAKSITSYLLNNGYKK